MEFRRRQPVGMELVKRGVITEENLNTALDYQRQHPSIKLGDIIYNLGLVDDPSLLIKNLGDILGVKGTLLTDETLKVKPTDYLTLDVCRKNKCIPFEETNGKIKVCFTDESKSKSNSVKLLLLNKGLIMEQYLTFEKEVQTILDKIEGEIPNNVVQTDASASVTTLVDNIIKTGMEKRASDIHIEPMRNEIRVRYRIDGQLFTEAKISKSKQNQIIGRLKSISNMHQEKQESQDGRILLYDDYNIRVSSQPNVYGEKFVLRLLKKDADIRDLHELGYPGSDDEIKKFFNKRNSITIVAAPTGEGKTTTLYSIVNFLNQPDINITTIEDPVEIRIDGLNQIEIGNKSTFSESLRTVLRQDPDIILVGEIRDRETAEIAVQAGQTGHYVLSTIHTIDSIEVVNRLRKMGLSDYDIASTLATSVSQRLVRRLCPHCRKKRKFTSEEKEIISKILKKYGEDINIDKYSTYDAVGCEQCNHSGYYGRIGVFEILNLTEQIKELIVNGKSTIDIRKLALEEGYRPLVVDGIKKVLYGDTNLQELNRKLLFY